MAESKVKYYKLGNASAFWDGSQSDKDCQKIAPGEVRPLEYNKKVKRLVGGGALEIASEAEYKEFLANQSKQNAEAKKVSTTQAKEVAKIKKQLSQTLVKNAELEQKNLELEEKLEELTKPPVEEDKKGK